MKIRWLAMSLVLFLLWGCEAPPEPESLPATEPEGTVVATDPTVPSGLYDPENELESATSGALQVFPLPFDNPRDIRFLGDDLLVFSGQGTTELTVLSGAERYISAHIALPCRISPDDPSVAVRAQSITFYDSTSHALVTLDEDLTETSRIPLAEKVQGTVALSPDCGCLYYCTENGVRILEPETGEDRLLVNMDFIQQELVGIHCGGSVLECSIADSEGIFRTRFLRAEDGKLLHETEPNLTLLTDDDFFFAVRDHGFISELITGSDVYGPSLLFAEQDQPMTLPVFGTHGTLLISTNENSTQLDFYNLDSGFHRYQLNIPSLLEPRCAVAGFSRELWLLCFDPATQSNRLCRWTPREPLDEPSTHLLPLSFQDYEEHPALEQYRQQASAISEEYGVHVLIRSDAAAASPWDYCFVPEQRSAFIAWQLKELDRVLSCYPEGFLKKLASNTPSGQINICLVREIQGIPGTGALDSATGIQYWDDDTNAYIAVISDRNMAQNICHELFHLIENRVFSDSCLYDDWSQMNPEDFTYDFDYLRNLTRDTMEWIHGENRAFVDLYSMSYPKEDRARIMEYAMLPEQHALFSCPILQKKLRTICLGIREAFDLERHTEPLLWEQYLEEPIH